MAPTADDARVKRHPTEVARPAATRFLTSVLIFAALAAAGCREQAQSATAPLDAGAIERGDSVVIERAAGEFIEARVADRSKTRLTVQPSDGVATIEVGEAAVYSISGTKPRLSPGDYAICNVQGRSWVACRVLGTEKDGLELEDLSGKRWILRPSRVLEPTDLTAMNVRRRFERSEARRGFEREAARAGPPRAPRGWRIGAGDRVLGRRGGAWFSAKVREIEDDVVFVEWGAGGRQAELARDDVVPDPPYDFRPRRGQYALARPAAISSPWRHVRVIGVLGEDTVRTADASGEKREMSTRDLVPLE